MTIEGIGSVIPPQRPYDNKDVDKIQGKNAPKSGDNIEISDKAKTIQEALTLVKKMEQLPEIRDEVIEKAKQNVQNKSYLKREVYEKIAEQILKQA